MTDAPTSAASSAPAETRTLRLAHSPDSDDLVMWWPLTGMRGPDGRPVDGPMGTPRVDTAGFAFELVGEDVEALNALAGTGSGGDAERPFDITAISAAAYPGLSNDWAVTRCGGSFGDGYGPRVVVGEDSPIRGVDDLRGKTIAVPGVRTSAFLALSMLLGDEAGGRGFDHEAMLFSDVPGAVIEGRADAGLLIHEAQLTFGKMGLRKVVDLGAWWTEQEDLPLPLGLNVIRRDLDDRFGPGSCEQVSRILSASVAYAMSHPEESRDYLLLHSEGRPEWRDPALVDEYLSMYVSKMSADMGDRGEDALRRFFAAGVAGGYLESEGGLTVL